MRPDHRTMPCKLSDLVPWILVPTVSFGLGWLLKPAGERDGAVDEAGLRAGGGSVTGPPPVRSLLPEAGGTEADPAVAGTKAGGAFRRGSREPLTAAAIEVLGQDFRSARDPIERRAAFSALLEGMTVENAREIREQIAHLPPQSPEFRDFHYAWGRIGGVDAVMHGADTEKPDMAATLAGWASADPAAATEWFANLEKQPGDGKFANQEYLKMGMVQGLADADPASAARFVLEMEAAGDKHPERLMTVVADRMARLEGAGAAADWAASLPDGKLRTAVLGHAGHQFAREDPAAAAAWAEPLLGEPGNAHLMHRIGHEWAAREGAAAVDWLATLDETPERSKAFQSTFEGWAGKDPAAASEYLVDMPASPDRDHAIGGLVNRHRWEDPMAAITWAEEIRDPQARTESLVRAGEAYHRRDPAAAVEWMATTDLPAEALKRIAGGRN